MLKKQTCGSGIINVSIVTHQRRGIAALKVIFENTVQFGSRSFVAVSTDLLIAARHVTLFHICGCTGKFFLKNKSSPIDTAGHAPAAFTLGRVALTACLLLATPDYIVDNSPAAELFKDAQKRYRGSPSNIKIYLYFAGVFC